MTCRPDRHFKKERLLPFVSISSGWRIVSSTHLFSMPRRAKPLAARAQKPAMPVVGFLRSTSLADATHLVTTFREGLKEAGFVQDQNVAVEYRYADNQIDRLPALS
jgi:hypothetical protein